MSLAVCYRQIVPIRGKAKLYFENGLWDDYNRAMMFRNTHPHGVDPGYTDCGELQCLPRVHGQGSPWQSTYVPEMC